MGCRVCVWRVCQRSVPPAWPVVLIHYFSLIGILFGIIVMWTPRIFSSEKESIPRRQEIMSSIPHDMITKKYAFTLPILSGPALVINTPQPTAFDSVKPGTKFLRNG